VKIYTGTGDQGETSLSGGARVPKNDVRIEAYGSVDELNSYIGLIKVQKINNDDKAFLEWIQRCLMTAAAVFASDYPNSKAIVAGLEEKDINRIEDKIDSIDKNLEALSSFIIPGGNTIISYCHIARCVCRKAERKVFAIDNIGMKSRVCAKYLNRLSDYLFVLSRKLTKDFKIIEIYWKPGSKK